MDPIAYWVGIGVALLGGGFLKDAIKWTLDTISNANSRRRTEVDRALLERDKARVERDEARGDITWFRAWTRRLEESLHVHRVVIIQASLPLPEWPEKPNRAGEGQ